MGIDIYLGGYKAYDRRSAEYKSQFDEAVQLLNRQRTNSPEYQAAQTLVEEAAHAMSCGKTGYLRSSYNNAGLFPVYEKLFGVDISAILFPGDWSKRVKPDWDVFLATVAAMREAAKQLKHGVRLPVSSNLKAEKRPERERMESFCAGIMGMLGDIAQQSGDDITVESGNDHQHGFYNEDDYQWYITEALDDLEEFGRLGKRTRSTVHISY